MKRLPEPGVQSVPQSSRRPVVLLLVIASFVLGCEDDPLPMETPSGSVAGNVTHVDDRPIQGASIVLVETATFRPVAGPLRTDASGRYAGDRVPVGKFGILVYGIDGMSVDHWTASTIDVYAGQTAVHDIVLSGNQFTGPGHYYVAGTVIDAVTLAPIRAAYVANASRFHSETEVLFRGYTLPSWGSTDSHGRFRVSSPYVQSASGEIGLEPISVSAAGYEPTTLVGAGPASMWQPFLGLPLPPLPAPIAPDSVLDVEVRLRPAGSSNATGVVRGLVTHQGEPVIGVRVYLSLNAVTQPDTVPAPTPVLGKSAVDHICVPLPERTAVTDANGSFEITGVPPGRYNAAAGYEPNDGYEPDYFPHLALATVTDGDTANVSLFPHKALSPLAPLAGEEVASQDGSVELQWEAMPVRPGWVLTSYAVYVTDSAGSRPRITVNEPRLVLTSVPPGPVRWSVAAGVRDDQRTRSAGGVFERDSWFKFSLAP